MDDGKEPPELSCKKEKSSTPIESVTLLELYKEKEKRKGKEREKNRTEVKRQEKKTTRSIPTNARQGFCLRINQQQRALRNVDATGSEEQTIEQKKAITTQHAENRRTDEYSTVYSIVQCGT